MTDETGFLTMLSKTPADDLVRLVYADWLDERTTDEATQKAQFLRVLCQLQTNIRKRKATSKLRAKLAELARPLPTEWLAVVSHLPIENCRANPQKRIGMAVIHINPPPTFDYECPKEWSSLTATENPNIRYCTACEHKVYYSDTIQVARQHASRGRCIAIDCALPRTNGDLTPPRRLMGRMLPNAVDRERERNAPDEVSIERERKKGRRHPNRTGFEDAD